jgi:hypothetical protein
MYKKSTWGQFHQDFTHRFCASRSQKRKKNDSLTVFFALFLSAFVKAFRKMLVKSTWCQFQRPIGEKQGIWHDRCLSVSPTKLHPTLPVHTTRSYDQLLRSISAFINRRVTTRLRVVADLKRAVGLIHF